MQHDSDIFVVTRGKRVKAVSEVYSGRPHQPHEANPHPRRLYTAQSDYSGTFYSNYFRADHAIELIDVGFFGPCYEEQAEYFVHMELFEPTSTRQLYPDCNSTRIGKRKCTAIANREQVFYVGFETPVRLEPHAWYLIQFMLNGPCTFRSEYTKLSSQVSVHEALVKFEFNVGSMQMPCLRFRLPNQ